MINVALSKYSDFLEIDIQNRQKFENGELPQYAKNAILMACSLTFRRDGEIVAIGGTSEDEEGRVIVWALLSKNIRPSMPSLFKFTRRFLSRFNQEVVAYIDETFSQSVRLVEMLGFERKDPVIVEDREYLRYVR